MTPEEIALNFSERFQKNYPKEPLWEMMDDLSNEIKYYASSMCKRQREKLDNQKWISVEERLPKNKYEHVLITDGENMFIGFFREDTKSWDNFNSGWVAKYYHDGEPIYPEITHWMPLPSAPLATEEVK